MQIDFQGQTHPLDSSIFAKGTKIIYFYILIYRPTLVFYPMRRHQLYLFKPSYLQVVLAVELEVLSNDVVM